jgi:hypothetical protein
MLQPLYLSGKITTVLLYAKFSGVQGCFRFGDEQNIANVTMGIPLHAGMTTGIRQIT